MPESIISKQTLKDDRAVDATDFDDRGPSPGEDLKWVLIAGNLLHHFADALNRIEGALIPLSQRGAEMVPKRPVS